MFSAVILIYAEMYDRRNHLRIRRRNLRDSSNPFTLPEERFKELFRFPTRLATELISELRPFMEQGERITFVPIHLRVLASLHFFATGSYNRDIGQDFSAALSKTMVCRAVQEVATVLQNELMSNWIKFPEIDDYAGIKLKYVDNYSIYSVHFRSILTY